MWIIDFLRCPLEGHPSNSGDEIQPQALLYTSNFTLFQALAFIHNLKFRHPLEQCGACELQLRGVRSSLVPRYSPLHCTAAIKAANPARRPRFYIIDW